MRHEAPGPPDVGPADLPTAAILANRVIPGALDHYLGRTGYSSQQQRGRPVQPNRPSNLFEPLPGDAGAHGIFDRQAHGRSYQTWASMHRGAMAAAGAGLLAVAGLMAGRALTGPD